MGKVKLQLLTTTDDTKDNIVSFTSGDTADPTEWKDVSAIESDEKHKTILEKISNMFNNIRFLYKNVGGIKGLSSSAAITNEGQYALDAREKNASIEGTLANEISKANSNFSNLLNRNSKNNSYNPTNTGYSTLRDFLCNEIFAKSDSSFCIFAASTFSDLPIASDWDFTIIAYITMGAVHVYAYKFLSNNEIYVRSMNASANWIDDWKQISFV